MIELENVKINDIVRYQYVMNDRNYYGIVKKITKQFIIVFNELLNKDIKFRKYDGWSTGALKYNIVGINDKQEQYSHDLQDLYYY